MSHTESLSVLLYRGWQWHHKRAHWQTSQQSTSTALQTSKCVGPRLSPGFKCTRPVRSRLWIWVHGWFRLSRHDRFFRFNPWSCFRNLKKEEQKTFRQIMLFTFLINWLRSIVIFPGYFPHQIMVSNKRIIFPSYSSVSKRMSFLFQPLWFSVEIVTLMLTTIKRLRNIIFFCASFSPTM